MSRLEADDLPQKQRRRAAAARPGTKLLFPMKKAHFQGRPRWRQNSGVKGRGTARPGASDCCRCGFNIENNGGEHFDSH